MDVKARMKEKLAELDFDFRRFTMEGLASWLKERRGRKILFIPWRMPPGLFGVWIADANKPRDYVFYERETIPLHQAHIQLHELCHILLGHSPAEIGGDKIRFVLRQADPSSARGIFYRSLYSEEEEMEAETLASLIQEIEALLPGKACHCPLLG